MSQSSPSTNDRPAPDQTEKLFDMKGKNALGRHGEDETCQYLIDHGHTILERNWRYGHLEIDIISLAGDGIHFVEPHLCRENRRKPSPHRNNGISQPQPESICR